jgi:DNA-binding HxlR family transcriptional regulator
MIMELLKHKDYVRALMALEHKPLRFNQLQNALKLNPTQIDRAVTFLRKGMWIIPRTLPSEEKRIAVEYSLGQRGKAFLESFKTFSAATARRKHVLGRSAVAEIQNLYH